MELHALITVVPLVEVLIVREAVQILVHQVVEVVVLETAMVSAKDVGLDVQTPVQVAVMVDVMDAGLDVKILALVLVKHPVLLFVRALALLIIVVIPVQVLIVVQMGAHILVGKIVVVAVKLELALASVQVLHAKETHVQQLVQLEIFQRLTLFQNKKLNN